MQAVPLYPESLKQTTWVTRALNLAEPRARAGVPWPLAWQSGRRAELEVYLPEAIGGDVPAGEAFVVAQTLLDAASGNGPAAPVPLPVARVFAPCRHGSYAVDIPAGESQVIYQGDRQRGYSLIVNAGAGAATLAYAKEADARSLPLAAAGVGFHELVHGTTSSVSVFSAAGTFVTVIDGAYDPPIDGEG